MAYPTAAFLPDVSCPLITLHSWQQKRLSAFCNRNSLFLRQALFHLCGILFHPSESLKFLLVRGPAKVSSDQCASVIPTNIPHVLQDHLRLKDISHLDPSFIRCPTGSCLFLTIQRLLTVTKNDRALPICREGDEPSFVLRAKRQGHHLVII